MNVFSVMVYFVIIVGLGAYFYRRKMREYLYALPMEQMTVQVVDKAGQSLNDASAYPLYAPREYSYSVSFQTLPGYQFAGKAKKEFFTMIAPGDSGVLWYKNWRGQIICCDFQSKS